LTFVKHFLALIVDNFSGITDKGQLIRNKQASASEKKQASERQRACCIFATLLPLL